MNTIKIDPELCSAHCGTVFEIASPLSPMAMEKAQKGLLMVCYQCGGFNKLGDANFSQLSTAEFEMLDTESKRILSMVRHQIESERGNN